MRSREAAGAALGCNRSIEPSQARATGEERSFSCALYRLSDAALIDGPGEARPAALALGGKSASQCTGAPLDSTPVFDGGRIAG